eukprot:scaffold184_cov316-Pinguiococcus_pyrenoidosus.AAC.60
MKFTFQTRAVPEGIESLAPPAAKALVRSQGHDEPILVAEQLEANRVVAESYLRRHGFRSIRLASSASEAIQLACETRFAACVVDRHLPEHDGRWVAEKLVELGYDRQQILLWAAAGDGDTDAETDADVDSDLDAGPDNAANAGAEVGTDAKTVTARSEPVKLLQISKPLGLEAVQRLYLICSKLRSPGAPSPEGDADGRCGSSEAGFEPGGASTSNQGNDEGVEGGEAEVESRTRKRQRV